MSLEAALVMVGDELLRGGRVDTNGPWLAGRLRSAGIPVVGLEVVGDDTGRIADAVSRAARSARVVLVSGGLGPTPDDRTREALARVLGVELVDDADALASITVVLSARGLDLDAGRRVQARVPAGGGWLRNAEGTAPGLRATVGDAEVFALPGVPRELKAMFDAEVQPVVLQLGPRRDARVAVVPCAGIPEAEVGHRLGDLAARRDVELGFYPSEGEIEVRLEADGDGAAERVRAVEREVRRRLGDAAWPAGRIEEEVVRLLRALGLTVTTAESITGGLVARMLTDVPGASGVFRGGWVTYSDAWKADALGVPAALLRERGAVSVEVARAMAEAARRRSGATAALATTGFAGPGPGRAPDGALVAAGTFHVAVAFEGRETEVRTRLLGLPRPAVRRRAAVEVLDRLRRQLGRDGTHVSGGAPPGTSG